MKPIINCEEILAATGLLCNVRTIHRILIKEGYDWKLSAIAFFFLPSTKTIEFSLQLIIFLISGVTLFFLMIHAKWVL